MITADYIVLVVYFLIVAGIGVWSMLRVKGQEDFFMGGRSFGRLLQVFAAFGAGTGSHDVATTARTTYTNGLSGIWSILTNLFVTPFYWFYGVWFRRMRLLTMGDLFVERFQSRAMGVAYTVFGTVFMVNLLGLQFTAIGKVCAVVIGVEQCNLPLVGLVPIEYILIPGIGAVVIFYGVLGGLRAAYWTDLLQGVCIVVLSVMLIPVGLNALSQRFGDASGAMDGFRVLHQQLPAEAFEIIGSAKSSEFTLGYIIVITVMNLAGIVVQPYMISIGGGSAKSENAGRVGLMVGTFMKRLCTIGWALTALIILALMAEEMPELVSDPDRAWGVATREILGPFGIGLVGLMLACLIAALMSSADCYMLTASALVVRNLYAKYVNPNASEKTYVLTGRLAGTALLIAAMALSLWKNDLFTQLKIGWEIPIIFSAPFWIGMFWRWTTRWAAWLTLAFTTSIFFVVPAVLPLAMPSLAENQRYTLTNDFVTTITTRRAAPADLGRRDAAIRLWQQEVDDYTTANGPQSEEVLIRIFEPRPEPLQLGELIEEKSTTGGKPIYWTQAVEVVDGKNDGELPEEKHLVEVGRSEIDDTIVIRQRYKADCRLRGTGSFDFVYMIYDMVGWDLRRQTNGTLSTLRWWPMLIVPFALIILLSLVTPRDDKLALDRFYAKMKTPVMSDPQADEAQMQASYRDPSRFDDKRLFTCLGLEIQKPGFVDVAGFVLGFLTCFAIIGLALWLASLGS